MQHKKFTLQPSVSPENNISTDQTSINSNKAAEVHIPQKPNIIFESMYKNFQNQRPEPQENPTSQEKNSPTSQPAQLSGQEPARVNSPKSPQGEAQASHMGEQPRSRDTSTPEEYSHTCHQCKKMFDKERQLFSGQSLPSVTPNVSHIHPHFSTTKQEVDETWPPHIRRSTSTCTLDGRPVLPQQYQSQLFTQRNSGTENEAWPPQGARSASISTPPQYQSQPFTQLNSGTHYSPPDSRYHHARGISPYADERELFQQFQDWRVRQHVNAPNRLASRQPTEIPLFNSNSLLPKSNSKDNFTYPSSSLKIELALNRRLAKIQSGKPAGQPPTYLTFDIQNGNQYYRCKGEVIGLDRLLGTQYLYVVGMMPNGVPQGHLLKANQFPEIQTQLAPYNNAITKTEVVNLKPKDVTVLSFAIITSSGTRRTPVVKIELFNHRTNSIQLCSRTSLANALSTATVTATLREISKTTSQDVSFLDK